MVIQIEGNSYRLKTHAALMPDNLKAAMTGHRDSPRKRPGRPRKGDLA
ncbi:MAG: hypothetical protein ABIK96_12530 [bacterium]